MKHYELEISRFVDNELSAGEQQQLFTHLADCEDCRKTLADFMEMKKETKELYENIDVDLKPEINLPVGVTPSKEKNIFKPLFYFSAAASIVFGLLFLINLSSVDRLSSKISLLELKYNRLTKNYQTAQKKDVNAEKKINEITSQTNTNLSEKKDNGIELKKNDSELIAINKNDKNLYQEKLKDNYFRPSRRTQEIKVVQVTKNDFLTPQIVGN